MKWRLISSSSDTFAWSTSFSIVFYLSSGSMDTYLNELFSLFLCHFRFISSFLKIIGVSATGKNMKNNAIASFKNIDFS